MLRSPTRESVNWTTNKQLLSELTSLNLPRMSLLDHPKLSFLAHTNWSGISAICGFIALPVALATTGLTIYLQLHQPEKKLEIRDDGAFVMGALPSTNEAPTLYQYGLNYSLINKGDLPISPQDFASDPAIMTTAPNSINSIITITNLRPASEKTQTAWTSPNKTEWTSKPFLLNKADTMHVLVVFVSPMKRDNADFDPYDYIHWNIEVAGLTDIRYTKFVTYAHVPTVISLAVPAPPVGLNIYFKDGFVWGFLALGIVSYLGVTFAWLWKRRNDYMNPYWTILHVMLLLFFSFSVAEIILCPFSLKQSLAWNYCGPILVLYAIYLYVLFRPTKT